MKQCLTIIFTFSAMLLYNVMHVFAQSIDPYYLQDRGTGVPSSMFGTYITKGEIVVYPFFEYYNETLLALPPKQLIKHRR